MARTLRQLRQSGCVIALYQQGLTYKAICEITGVKHISSIYNLLRRHKVPLRHGWGGTRPGSGRKKKRRT